MKHLPVGGSTAERTIKCPAWLERAKTVPKPPASVHANEGNLKHDAMELYYRDDVPFEELVGKLTYADLTLNEDHLPSLYNARDQVELVFAQYDIVEYVCEPFVQLEEDYIGGSIDLIGVSADGETVVVLDYKFGRVQVSAEENRQLLFYAMCAMADPATKDLFKKATDIVYVIVQPAVDRDPDIWESDKNAVVVFQDELHSALNNPRRAQPGKWCKYCPVAMACPDKRAQALSALVLDPKTAALAGKNLDLADELEDWIKATREQAQHAIAHGAIIPGYKLVEKKTQRKFTGEAETVLSGLENARELFVTKPKTLTQIEKILGKDELKSLKIVEKPTGKPELAKESDRRPALPIESATKNLAKLVAKNK